MSWKAFNDSLTLRPAATNIPSTTSTTEHTGDISDFPHFQEEEDKDEDFDHKQEQNFLIMDDEALVKANIIPSQTVESDQNLQDLYDNISSDEEEEQETELPFQTITPNKVEEEHNLDETANIYQRVKLRHRNKPQKDFYIYASLHSYGVPNTLIKSYYSETKFLNVIIKGVILPFSCLH